MNKKIILIVVIAALLYIFKDKIFGDKLERVSEGSEPEDKPKSRKAIKIEQRSALKSVQGRGYEGYEPMNERGHLNDLRIWRNSFNNAHTHIPNS